MAKIQCVCVECHIVFEQWPSVVKRTGGRFCSISCSVKNRNRREGNPASRPEVRAKISANHADVSGEKNPMFGRTGRSAPGYIDGRNLLGRGYRGAVLANNPAICQSCGKHVSRRKLHVHHKDKNRKNNVITNLVALCSKCHSDIHPMTRDDLGRFERGLGSRYIIVDPG